MVWDGTERRKDNGAPIERIMNRLTDIEIQIATVNSELKSNHKAFRDSESESKRLIEKMTETIYGNGHPGITSNINGLKTATETLSNELVTHRKSDTGWFTLLAGLLLTILGWTVFKH